MGVLVEVRYEHADMNDLDVLLEIQSSVFDQFHRHRHCLSRIFSQKLTRCVKATVNGRIVGYALFKFNPSKKSANLYALAVLPEYRWQSIGTNLLLWIEVEALQEGASVLFTGIATENVGAIHMCRKIGYVEYTDRLNQSSIERPFLKEGEDIILLRKVFSVIFQDVGPTINKHWIAQDLEPQIDPESLAAIEATGFSGMELR